MTAVGADIAQLRDLASRLMRASRDLVDHASGVTAVVEALPWAGDDREAFLRTWKETHLLQIGQLSMVLVDTSRAASHHAAQQEQASQANP